MTGDERREIAEAMLADENPGAMFADGWDDAILGVARIYVGDPVVVYDLGKIVDALIEDGATREDALEYVQFNITGAYVGEGTPAFLDRIEDWER